MDAAPPDAGRDDVAPPPPPKSWAISIGGMGQATTRRHSIAVDPLGNTYLVGSFYGTQAFGSTTLSSQSYLDMLIAKLDADGKFLWAMSPWAYYDAERGISIAVDGGGNSYVPGSFVDPLQFGSKVLNAEGGSDIFVAKLDPNGNTLWAVTAGGACNDAGRGIAVDAAGNSYVTGSIGCTGSFGSTALDAWDDLFVAKLDPNGSFLWAKSAKNASQNDDGQGIAVDGNGGVYVTGSFHDVSGFGSTAITASGGDDILVAKLDASGNPLWNVRAGGAGNDWGSGIAVDASGNSFVTGTFYGQAKCGSVSLSGSGSWDVLVAKLSPNGACAWATPAGGAGSDWGYAITLDQTGAIYVTGAFQASASFGSTTLQTTGSYADVFVAKLNSAGVIISAQSAGGSFPDFGYGIGVDGNSDLRVTGVFWSKTAVFGPTTLVTDGSFDTFVWKLPAASL